MDPSRVNIVSLTYWDETIQFCAYEYKPWIEKKIYLDGNKVKKMYSYYLTSKYCQHYKQYCPCLKLSITNSVLSE